MCPNCNMDIEKFRQICLSFNHVTEEFPFGPDTLVYKVKGKLFALAGMEVFESINLKCDPEEAIELRERYAAVRPGFHMNKQHWNTILIDNSIPDRLIEEWIKKSYNLVRSKLPKSQR